MKLFHPKFKKKLSSVFGISSAHEPCNAEHLIVALKYNKYLSFNVFHEFCTNFVIH